MHPRVNGMKTAPEAYKTMRQLEQIIAHESGLEPGLIHLVKLRASQINGCAYCIDMHSKDSRAAGETEQRLYGLDAWRECPYYSDRERAALAWTEAITLIREGHAPDAVYEEVKRHFSDEEFVYLTLAISAINTWNRLGIGFRLTPGEHQPATQQARKAA